MNRMMIAAAAALALAPAAALAQNAPMMTTGTTDAPLLSFSVSEEVRSRPDRATIGAGVSTTAMTAVEALRQNSAAMDKLIKAAKARGIKDEDIQTSGLSLAPQYDYTPQQQGQPPRFTGYMVSNQVRATTDDIAKLGELLDALIAAGGTNIDGPTFSVKDADAKLVGAREAALAKATAKANDYARLAGYRSARLIGISEGSMWSGPQPMPVMAADSIQMTAAKFAPVEPGQIANALTLNVQYRLER